MSTIAASTNINTGYKVTADATGTLVFQTGATPTTAMTIDASQNLLLGTTSATTLPTGYLSAANTFGFKNRLINGAMVINQRGTQTGSPLSAYTLDRWLFSRSGTGTSTVSQSSTLNYGGQYALNISSAHAAGEVFGIEQRIESVNSYDLAGKTVTVQFYANATTTAGALGSFTFSLSYANSTDNFSSVTSIGSVAFTPTSTPTLFTATFSVPSAATTGLKLIFSGGQTIATGTITFNLGGVQLEKGSTATSFDYRPYGTELNMCMRYFQFSGFGFYGTVESGSTTTIAGNQMYQVPMRAQPTASITSGVNAQFRMNGGDYQAATPVLSNYGTTPYGYWTNVGGFTGMTSLAAVHSRNNTSYGTGNFISLSAEL